MNNAVCDRQFVHNIIDEQYYILKSIRNEILNDHSKTGPSAEDWSSWEFSAHVSQPKVQKEE